MSASKNCSSVSWLLALFLLLGVGLQGRQLRARGERPKFFFGDRSSPNLFGPTSAGVHVRQRGAHSRIGIDGVLSCRGFLLPGSGRRGVCKELTMPKNKDLKRLIRARMAKTGESYTAARSHLLARDLPLPGDYPKLAGMSDEAVQRASGKTWREWTTVLDQADAAQMEHREIAEYVHSHFEVSGWWAQMITVAYERFRGLRDFGQRRGGGYDVNKSKTIGVPVAALWTAFHDPDRRAQWLSDVELTIRTATEPKSMRMRLADETPLNVYFTAKGERKSAVSLQILQLPDKETADRAGAVWHERLESLKELLLPSESRMRRRRAASRQAD